MMHAPTLWTSQGGGGGGGGYPVEVVTDFAALDTQDLSTAAVGDVVTLSDGSTWTVVGSPFAATSFGIVAGQGLVFSTLMGIVGMEVRGLARWTGDVDPSFASGACRMDAQFEMTSVLAPDVTHGITAYWPQLGPWPAVPTPDGPPGVYAGQQIVSGGPFASRVRTFFGTPAGEYSAAHIALATYPGDRGLPVPQSYCLGIDVAPGGTIASMRGTCWPATTGPLAWPTDRQQARTGYADVGRAVTLGAPAFEGPLNSWSAGGADAGPTIACATQLYFGASNHPQTARVRAVRWRTAA